MVMNVVLTESHRLKKYSSWESRIKEREIGLVP